MYFKQLITEHSTIFSPIFCSIVMSSVLDFYYIFSFLDFVRVAKLKLNNFIFLNFLCLYNASGKWGSINIGKLITGRNALHSQQLSCTLLSNKMYSIVLYVHIYQFKKGSIIQMVSENLVKMFLNKILYTVYL